MTEPWCSRNTRTPWTFCVTSSVGTRLDVCILGHNNRIASCLPTIRTESSHLAVNRGILTHPRGKKSRTSEFRQVFRCGSVATQKCNGNYQYKDQQTQQTKFNHRRVENGA